MLVASDIFGISASFLAMLDDIGIAKKAIVVSPYSQPQVPFNNEEHAYACFQEDGGIEAYISRISDAVGVNSSIEHAIGFSAGGAALYNVFSEQTESDAELTLFYPGQIRHFLDQHPDTSCRIIFPESEPHFLLGDVINALKNMKVTQSLALTIEQNSYQHGFMNTASKGFNQAAYQYYCQMLSRLFNHS